MESGQADRNSNTCNFMPNHVCISEKLSQLSNMLQDETKSDAEVDQMLAGKSTATNQTVKLRSNWQNGICDIMP